MGIIRALDAATISKIAAGEVVERPVSVVKELVENAIDAKSTEITINIEDGGHKLIRVSDNGVGMTPEDAAMCLKSHTTSKLLSTEDLEKILTYGFRGEALHSIGAVSRLTVTTSTGSDGVGYRVRMEGAVEQPAESTSRVRGTTVEVENLFYNVPARRKFMKSARSEIQAIDTFVARMIIGQPNVKFILTHNGANVFSVPGGQQVPDRIRYVLGKDIAGRVVRATATDGKNGLDAYFTMPDTTFPNRKYQIFFVNGRLVKDRYMTTAVDTAYRGLIPGARYGLAILFVDIVASDIDANVHPAKTEIRFVSPHDIHSLIYRALRGRFSDGDTPEKEVFSLVTTPRDKEPKGMMPQFDRKKAPPAPAPMPVQTEFQDPAPTSDDELISKNEDVFKPEPSQPSEESFKPAGAAQFESRADQRLKDEITLTGKQYRVLAQFYKTYILIEMEGEPVFIDQHVASERIIYNELKRRTLRRPEQLQLISEPIEVPLEIYNTLSENLETVKAAGVEIEPFGERAFVIRAVAHNVGALDPTELLAALAHEISAAPNKTPSHVLTDKLLTVASCKMAIKAGQELTLDEMRSLIEAYLKEEFNRTCPHGRPIIHKVTKENLNVWFKR